MNGLSSGLNLTEDEEREARRMAEIAARAEAKAEARDLARREEEQRATKIARTDISGTKFLTKAEREKLALERLEQRRQEQEKRHVEDKTAYDRFTTGKAEEERRREARMQKEEEDRARERRLRDENKRGDEYDHELKAIREHYLGGKEVKKRVTRNSEKFAKMLKFDWDDDEDTGRSDKNPLYNDRLHLNPMFGRGYIAGIDLREQRKESKFLEMLSLKRAAEARAAEAQDERLTADERRDREIARAQAISALKMRQSEELQALDEVSMGKSASSHWSEKSLEEMSERDWRIFREDFDIRIQGGRATLPLRYWSEAHFPKQIMRAIEEVKYTDPSPIQRQAIPVGLEKRDIIGIAETGSGKTASFTIPMLVYMLNLPRSYIDRCADQGPLAVIMAPARELAQQIEQEIVKLAKYTGFETACIVGGQDIEQQGFKLRKGVHVIVGTPGRILDCLENNYLVLNQCNYIILDEADRMVDMGFEPQIVGVLDNMGGLLKSEDETQAEEQIIQAKEGTSLVRITAMFSATMPPGVERIARTYLRHPVIIKIGDEDTGKNKRIEQRVQFITAAQKKNFLLEDVQKLKSTDKCIIFVNEKKQGDFIGKLLDANELYAGVLHGGRSQDQREETLELFRKGQMRFLVATDVAGRGLDISDVTHVINFDMPAQITNYNHRIGRTGRAGKSGVAITYLTSTDTEVMYDLKNYLESTGSVIPAELAHHEAARAPPGSRRDDGKLVGQKRDSVQFSSK